MTQFESQADVAAHMGEPVEAPEWFDHQVEAYAKQVVPWLNELQGTNKLLEDVRLEIIEKFRTVVHMEVVVKVWTTQEGVYAFDIEPVRNLEAYDPDRMAHEIVNNYLDIPADRGKGEIKTDKGLVQAMSQGDPGAQKLWTPGAG